MKLIPKNWVDHQHYKDRNPPWIKLHRKLLNDRAFMCLPLASKALAPLLWLLASESKSENGEFDASTEELEFRLHMSVKDIETGRKALIDKGFFIDASGVLASCQQVATPETEGEREERQRKEREEEESYMLTQRSARSTRSSLFSALWVKSVFGHGYGGGEFVVAFLLPPLVLFVSGFCSVAVFYCRELRSCLVRSSAFL